MKTNADVLLGFHREIALAICTDVLIRVHWPMKPNMSYTDNQKGVPVIDGARYWNSCSSGGGYCFNFAH